MKQKSMVFSICSLAPQVHWPNTLSCPPW